MKKSFKQFIKLTNFEFERIFKFLAALIGLTFASNIIGSIYLSSRFMNQFNEFAKQGAATTEQATQQFGHFSFFNLVNSFWINGPIAIGISALLFYAFFTWYREWSGKNTFIYRLLILPVNRMNIFFSKLSTIFIAIFSLLASQMVSLAISYPIVSLIVDSDLLEKTSLMESISQYLTFHYLFPINPWLFLAINGIGLTFLIVLFTLILMERSYGIKGMILGVLYGFLSIVFLLSPFYLPDLLNNYYILYGSETMFLSILSFSLLGVISLFISRHLINKKITV